MRSESDLTASARIRDAALERFGTDGYAGTSVRTIATAAGVSPALILHHFGSKDGLREACDEHVLAFFETMLGRVGESQPTESMSQFEGFTDESMTMMRYLMRQASEDSPRANALVADIVELTKQSMAEQTAKGYVKLTDDPDMRAAVLVMLRLGPLLFSGAMQQATGADVVTREGLRRMYRTTIEILESGIYTRKGVPHEGALLEQYDANTKREAHDH
jgi:AcrR family transcriptional regulator